MNKIFAILLLITTAYPYSNIYDCVIELYLQEKGINDKESLTSKDYDAICRKVRYGDYYIEKCSEFKGNEKSYKK